MTKGKGFACYRVLKSHIWTSCDQCKNNLSMFKSALAYIAIGFSRRILKILRLFTCSMVDKNSDL
jgi:hypothetical protein